MTTGEKLKKLRNDREMSEKEFADMLGISQEELATYENGETVLNDDLRVEISLKLGLDADTLVPDIQEELVEIRCQAEINSNLTIKKTKQTYRNAAIFTILLSNFITYIIFAIYSVIQTYVYTYANQDYQFLKNKSILIMSLISTLSGIIEFLIAIHFYKRASVKLGNTTQITPYMYFIVISTIQFSRLFSSIYISSSDYIVNTFMSNTIDGSFTFMLVNFILSFIGMLIDFIVFTICFVTMVTKLQKNKIGNIVKGVNLLWLFSIIMLIVYLTLKLLINGFTYDYIITVVVFLLVSTPLFFIRKFNSDAENFSKNNFIAKYIPLVTWTLAVGSSLIKTIFNTIIE